MDRDRYPRKDAYSQGHLYPSSPYQPAGGRVSPAYSGYLASHSSQRDRDRGGVGYRSNASSSTQDGTFRSATPNSRGQYSASVLEELESQNDEQFNGLRGKVKMMKEMSEAIGVEIRESSTLIENMNNSFESTRVKLKGTMNRMMIMAQRSGIGWKVWLMFFMLVFFLFTYVWLF